MIEEDGWYQVRVKGSHRAVSSSEETTYSNDSGKLSVDLPPGTLNSVRKQAGLMDEVMRYLVIIEKGDSSWGAHVPDLPGCIAVAKTREEVIKVIKEAIEFHIPGLRKHGDPIPPPSSEGQFVDTDAA